MFLGLRCTHTLHSLWPPCQQLHPSCFPFAFVLPSFLLFHVCIVVVLEGHFVKLSLSSSLSCNLHMGSGYHIQMWLSELAPSPAQPSLVLFNFLFSLDTMSSYVSQACHELAVQSRLTSNLLSSCLCLLNTGIAGMCHHAQL